MGEKTNDENSVTPFAVTNYRDIRKAFGIKEKNRRGHMYAIGKTGTGKSTLLKNMIVSDLKDGNGLAVIDPAGDLADELLNFIPKERIQDVVYLNPADSEFPVAFNPLEDAAPERRHLVVSGIINVFKKAWPDFWGPRLEHILRNTLLALLEYPNSTLLDIPPFLTDKFYRWNILEKVNNREVRNFWLKEFEAYPARIKSDATSPVLNKVGQYLSTPIIRNILGQPKGALNIRDVMDTRKILICNLSKGLIGEDHSSVLGCLLISQIQLAALSRGNVPVKDRAYFYLFVDEVHSFATLSLTDILSESRKYGLCLVLAHQYIGQLDEKIQEAIFGNVGTLISFRVGQADARILAQEFHPVFDQSDLVDLPNHHICLKLLIDGVSSDAFRAITLPAPSSGQSYREKVIQASKRKYARPRKEVEQDILTREVSLLQSTEKKNPNAQSQIQKLPL